ncbi:MAG: hypothetical protein KDI90_00245 [Alphaproteobacteria bacterium]|nr:hypothetical protein [Alphaproteobacteria bacterium]MCB9974681.1 hypothetical protein [Rhodospirillales bacterium]
MRLALIVVLSIAVSTTAWAGEHFENAKRLYTHGPSQANAIIKELELELKENPESSKALMLLAITQRGVGDFKSSQISLNKAEAILKKKDTVNPKVFLLRAENYIFLGEYEQAEKILTSMWAFFEGSEALKTEHKRLLDAAKEGKKKNNNLSLVNLSADYILSIHKDSILGWAFVVVSSEEFKSLSEDNDLKVAIPIANKESYEKIIAVKDKQKSIYHYFFFLNNELKAYLSSEADSKLLLINQPIPKSKEIVYSIGQISADNGSFLDAYQVIQE